MRDARPTNQQLKQKGSHMAVHISFARSLRLERLGRAGSGLFVVPLDHAVADGPFAGAGLDELVGEIAGNGADAIVLHKGAVRHVRPQWFVDVALIVHLNASTAFAADPDAKVLVARVEEAVRLGADAVSVHVNLGSDGEREQLADLATVADAADRWNVPLLAMMYPRGPRITNPPDPGLIAHAVSVAAELGADLVKTAHPGSFDGWHADVTRVLSAATDLTSWALYDRWPLARWHSRRIALIGDAAHPMLPFGAQGANQAIESAVALATMLAGGCGEDITASLTRYARLRAPRLRQVSALVRRNGAELHLPDGDGQRRRDRALSEHSGLSDQAWLYGYDAEADARGQARVGAGPSSGPAVTVGRAS
jgi:2-amino-4,5-dihydroxy-6-oxo-7-(phosphonooxy)heptanoate synthase